MLNIYKSIGIIFVACVPKQYKNKINHRWSVWRFEPLQHKYRDNISKSVTFSSRALTIILRGAAARIGLKLDGANDHTFA